MQKLFDLPISLMIRTKFLYVKIYDFKFMKKVTWEKEKTKLFGENKTFNPTDLYIAQQLNISGVLFQISKIWKKNWCYFALIQTN